MVLVYSSMFTPTCTVYDTKKDEEESWNLPSEINPDDVVGEILFFLK